MPFSITEEKNADAVLLGLGLFGISALPLASPPVYADIGYIKGAEFTYSRELVEFESAGLIVKRAAFRDRFSASIEVAEVSIDNLSALIPGTVGGNVFEFGGEKRIDRYAARFEHLKDNGDLLRIDIYRTIPGGDFTLSFAEEEFITFPTEWVAEADTVRDPGKQYGMIEVIPAA